MPVTTDRYALYQQAVQNPAADVALIDRVYRELFRRAPRTLREDFCGTAAVSAEWARSHSRREAWAVDLDDEPLAWARTHNAHPRVTLMRGDSAKVRTPAVDVVAVQNFSFFCLKTRAAFLAYARNAHRALNAKGMLFLDVMGGSVMQDDDVSHSRKLRGFTYRFEQKTFDPITHDVVTRIFFDGKPAFEYDWRLWTLPEIRDVLVEAGFRDVAVYWPHSEPKTGAYVYRRREKATVKPTWLAYVAALR